MITTLNNAKVPLSCWTYIYKDVIIHSHTSATLGCSNCKYLMVETQASSSGEDKIYEMRSLKFYKFIKQ